MGRLDFSENRFAAITRGENRKRVKNLTVKKSKNAWHRPVYKAWDGTGKAGFDHYGDRKSKNRRCQGIDLGARNAQPKVAAWWRFDPQPPLLEAASRPGTGVQRPLHNTYSKWQQQANRPSSSADWPARATETSATHSATHLARRGSPLRAHQIHTRLGSMLMRTCSRTCSRLCRVNGKPTQPSMLKHGKTSKAHISITVSDRPMIFFLLGRPRVGLGYSILAFEFKVMSRSRAPNQMPTTRNQAQNSVTISLGLRIIVVRVGPRVGPMTLTSTSTLKVIPRSNAPNDSKVSANVSEVILGHPRAPLSSLGQVAQNSQKRLQNSHFSSQFDQIWNTPSHRPLLHCPIIFLGLWAIITELCNGWR